MLLFTKKEMQSFLGITNYLGKLSLANAELCEPLRNLISLKSKWMLNSINQHLYDRAKMIVKEYVTVALYNEKEQLYLAMVA